MELVHPFGESASSDLGKPLQRANLGAFGQYAANRVMYSCTSLLKAELCSSALGTHKRARPVSHRRSWSGGYGA